MKFEISAEPAAPPEAGVKVHVRRKGEEMRVKACCEKMEQHQEIDIHYLMSRDSTRYCFRLAFDSYLFGDEVYFCPFCGKRLEAE